MTQSTVYRKFGSKPIFFLLAMLIMYTMYINKPAAFLDLRRLVMQTRYFIFFKFQEKFYNNPIPVSYINDKVLNYKLNHPPRWALTQIKHDLANYPASTLTSENVDTTYNKLLAAGNCVVKVKFNDTAVTLSELPQNANGAQQHAYKIYNTVFQHIAAQKYLHKVEFILRLNDFFIATDLETPAPVFTVARNNADADEAKLILIPDWMNLFSWYKLQPRIETAMRVFPWHKKQNIAFWRGGVADISGYRKKVVEYSQINGNFVNAKFVTSNQEFISPENHLQYKFQLTIDGHTATWERYVWQLHSNCVILKPNSPLVQWFYAALNPGEHYIPISDDPADIEPTVSRYSEFELKQIANNATEFAKNNLTLDDMVAYIILSLRQLEQLRGC